MIFQLFIAVVWREWSFSDLSCIWTFLNYSLHVYFNYLVKVLVILINNVTSHIFLLILECKFYPGWWYINQCSVDNNQAYQSNSWPTLFSEPTLYSFFLFLSSSSVSHWSWAALCGHSKHIRCCHLHHLCPEPQTQVPCLGEAGRGMLEHCKLNPEFLYLLD